jgi:predicted alpha/beta-fold hydrolase
MSSRAFKKSRFCFNKFILTTGTAGIGLFMYFNAFSTKLEIIGQNSPLNVHMINSIRELRVPKYRSFFLLPFRFSEIIYGAVSDKKHHIKYEREIIKSVDNENIVLDWGTLHAKYDDSDQDLNKIPIVFILPGLSGSSSANYVKAAANQIRTGKMRPVVVNPRGSVSEQVSENIFDYRYTENDLEIAIQHVKNKYPKANMYFFGFSFGASYGTKVLARNQDIIKGMVCVANPFDMYKAGESLNSKKNFIYA